MRNILCSLLIWLPVLCSAQYFEAGLRTGISFYRGELDKTGSLLSINIPHAAVGVFGRFNVHEYLAIRSDITYGTLEGSDARSTNSSLRKRNLSFKSSIMEANLVGEINLFGFSPDKYGQRWSPYAFGGIGVFHFNPKTNYQGQMVALQPLHTEGQANTYALTQFCVPVGGGIKFLVHPNLTVSCEVGSRFTFTDYIDDVSGRYADYNTLMQNYGPASANLSNRQWEIGLGELGSTASTGRIRGDSSAKDWYVFITTSVSYNFIGDSLFAPSQRTKNNRARRCFRW